MHVRKILLLFNIFDFFCFNSKMFNLRIQQMKRVLNFNVNKTIKNFMNI